MNDQFGRKPSILFADLLFFVGDRVMAAARIPGIIILGRIFVGFGVGMVSMTSPLYISEASPARIRGALVSTTIFVVPYKFGIHHGNILLVHSIEDELSS